MTEETIPRNDFPGGYAGQILRVDMTSGRTWVERRPEAWYRKWIGGVGFGAAVLWDEVPPEITWDHPENRLVLATGPIAGMPVWGSGMLTVVTRGAMTGGATSTQAQGFFGPNLKYSGYDAIIVQGRSEGWKYLYINDEVAELRDAAHLAGKDTWETQDLLHAEHGRSGHHMSVYGIGPAGENLVRFAAIEGDYGHVASKNGCGAVMGSKRLKCVCIVRGTKPLRAPDIRGVFEIADEMAYEHQYDPAANLMYRWGTLTGMTMLNLMGALPIRNYTTNVMPDLERYNADWEAPALRERFEHRGHQCNACGMKHCHQLVVPDGPHKGEVVDEPEYEGFSGAGTTIGSRDPVATAWLNTQVDRACVDVNEFGWVIGWVMECLEKGYLTPEQVGLDLKWGDSEGANRLLQMISRREGFGNLLAEGVKRAAETIGGPAAECAVFNLKGAPPRGHDHRGMWPEMLDTCLSSTGTLEVGFPTRQTELGLPARMNSFDPEEMPRTMGKILGRRHLEDSIGMCNFTTKSTLATLSRALSAVTGWDFRFEEARTFGRRVAAVLRAFNLRCGIGPELEHPGPRYGSTPVDGPAAGISILPVWDQMRRAFYEECGYDWETGRPTVELLQRLDLEDLVPAVWGAERVGAG